MSLYSKCFFKYVVLMLVALSFLTGCSTLQKDGKTTEPVTLKKEETAPSKAVYFDFKDVLIPGELMLNQELSSVYQVGNIPGGILTFDCRVEVNSLIHFFEVSMKNDGWQIAGKFKSRKSYLLFQKSSRNCVIIITADYFNTQVAVWVTTGSSNLESQMNNVPVKELPLGDQPTGGKSSTSGELDANDFD